MQKILLIEIPHKCIFDAAPQAHLFIKAMAPFHNFRRVIVRNGAGAEQYSVTPVFLSDFDGSCHNGFTDLLAAVIFVDDYIFNICCRSSVVAEVRQYCQMNRSNNFSFSFRYQQKTGRHDAEWFRRLVFVPRLQPHLPLRTTDGKRHNSSSRSSLLILRIVSMATSCDILGFFMYLMDDALIISWRSGRYNTAVSFVSFFAWDVHCFFTEKPF